MKGDNVEKKEISMTPELEIFFIRLADFKEKLFNAVAENPELVHLYNELNELFLNEKGST